MGYVNARQLANPMADFSVGCEPKNGITMGFLRGQRQGF